MSVLTLGTHVQRGLRYLVCLCVCLSVSNVAYTSLLSTLNRYSFLEGFSLILTHGFSKKLSVQKIRRERPNMLMTSSSTPTPFTHFQHNQSTATTWRTTGEPSISPDTGYRGRQQVREEKIESAWPVSGMGMLHLRHTWWYIGTYMHMVFSMRPLAPKVQQRSASLPCVLSSSQMILLLHPKQGTYRLCLLYSNTPDIS